MSGVEVRVKDGAGQSLPWPSEAQEKVLQEVAAERERQDAKWGAQRTLPADTWIRILGEEYGEVCKAVNENNPHDYRAELVQVAAVAVAAIEALDLRSQIVGGRS